MIEEFPKVELKPYEPAKDREQVRTRLAYVLVGVLAALILAICVNSVVGDENSGQVMVDTVFPAVLGLTGAIMGFYFGDKSR